MMHRVFRATVQFNMAEHLTRCSCDAVAVSSCSFHGPDQFPYNGEGSSMAKEYVWVRWDFAVEWRCPRNAEQRKVRVC